MLSTITTRRRSIFWSITNKRVVEDIFFLSLLYKKFISKVCYRGGAQNGIERFVFFSVFTMSVMKLLKKPFFFMFFHLFEKLSVNFALLFKRRGRRVYFIPCPIAFQSRYKRGLQVCKKLFSGTSGDFGLTSVVSFSQERVENKILFFLLSYLLKNKNFATAGVYSFKKKIKKNRVFAHWRWR
jgi:hypothetical protein